MKKLFTIFAVLVLAMAMNVMATQTRTLVMGNNNMIMTDDANVWMFPSRVNNYPNIATGEFDGWNASGDFYNFGINWKFNDNNPWVLGTYISTAPDAIPMSYTGSVFSTLDFEYYYPDTEFPGATFTNRRIDLLYGRKFSNYNFGFSFGYAYQSDWLEGTGNEFEQKFTNYTLGFGLTPDNGKWDLALWLAFASWTDKNNAGAVVTEPDGYMDVAAMFRYFYTYNPTITFVPHIMAQIGTHGEKTVTPDVEDTKSKLTMVDIGCGMNYMPVTNVLAVIDFGINYASVKDEFTVPGPPVATTEDKYTDMHFPYWKIGLEGEVTSWMDVRFGAVSEWNKFKEEDVQGYNYALNETFLGAGLNFGRFHIDTYTDPEILLDGLNFISGTDDIDDLNFSVSILYEMF